MIYSVVEKMENKKLSNYSLDDWVEMLYFKNYLEVLSLDELLEKCDDKFVYASVIDTANILLDVESVFFLLDDNYIEKLQTIINTYRFKFFDTNFFEVANEVIVGLNELSSFSQEKKLFQLENYLMWQEESRKFSFSGPEELKAAVANDILVYLQFAENADFGLFKGNVISSLNYFLAVCPQVFDDTNFYEKTVHYLNSYTDVPFYKRRGAFYQYATETKNELQKVKKS